MVHSSSAVDMLRTLAKWAWGLTHISLAELLLEKQLLLMFFFERLFGSRVRSATSALFNYCLVFHVACTVFFARLHM